MAEPELPQVGEYSPRAQLLAGALLGVIFIILWFVSGGLGWPSGWFVISVGLGAVLLTLAAFDMHAHILPDLLTLPLLLAGLLVNGLWPISLLWAAIGAASGYGLIAGLRWLWLRRTGVEAIGLGDAKLLAAGGAWVGAAGLPIVLLVASSTGLAAALLGGSYFKDKALPFGVFLALGVWVSWCFWVTPLMMGLL
ncbi:MAG: prepilin peptidase [Pseudomonadota bacterium]